MIIEQQDKHIFITCTEREARHIAIALAYRAEIFQKIAANTQSINQLNRMAEVQQSSQDKWAKEIFEKVGY